MGLCHIRFNWSGAWWKFYFPTGEASILKNETNTDMYNQGQSIYIGLHFNLNFIFWIENKIICKKKYLHHLQVTQIIYLPCLLSTQRIRGHRNSTTLGGRKGMITKELHYFSFNTILPISLVIDASIFLSLFNDNIVGNDSDTKSIPANHNLCCIKHNYKAMISLRSSFTNI